LRLAFLLSSARKRGKPCQTFSLDMGHYDPLSRQVVIDFHSPIIKSYEIHEYRQVSYYAWDTFLKSITQIKQRIPI
jgi:hypothetical protein